MRVAMAQINPTVGDLEGNLSLIREAIRRGEESSVQLVVLSELCISGYPPKDLLARSAFVRRCGEALDELAAGVGKTAALVGLPRGEPQLDRQTGFQLLRTPPRREGDCAGS